ncbi:MAG TPA: hypothetical protein VII06_38345 [Chloroflexota bacterium]|jgi:hypothetical protein
MMVRDNGEVTQDSLWPELVAPKPAGAGASPVPTRLCKQCAQPIPAPVGRRVYCSPECREQARPPRRPAAEPEDGGAERSPDRAGVSDPVPAAAASDAPSPPSARAELSAQRRLMLAWQLLSAYRPAALWQALEPDDQTQATTTILALYQWIRDLEPFARRHRGS